MKLVKRIRAGIKAFRAGISISDLDKIIEGSYGYNSYTGKIVSGDLALNISAVWNAVLIISQTVASLPLFVYRRNNRGREKDLNHPLYRILHDEANEEMTAFTFREVLTQHILLWGNGYAEIVRNHAGDVVALWPLNPERTHPKRDDSGKLIYVHRDTSGREYILPAERVFHIPGLSFDGRVGYSVISRARETFGLASATEEFGARLFGQGAISSGVLKHPGRIGDLDAIENLRKQWTDTYSGLGNAHKPIILEEGMEYTPLTIPPEDAQFLGTRKFQITEIARWFNIPPHKIKDLERATFSNIEEQQIEFVMDCIRPWLVRWEQHIKWKLLSKPERRIYFVEHVIDGLLRGNIEARYKAYDIARRNGVLSANEWRALENMNPIEGKEGDVYWMPVNMINMADIAVSSNTREQRSLKITDSRRRIAMSYKPLFEKIERKILEKEEKDVMRKAKQFLGESKRNRDVGEFMSWLDKYYDTHKAYMISMWTPVFLTLASAIEENVSLEMGTDTKIQNLDDFTGCYLDKNMSYHTGSAIGQIRQVVRNSDNPMEALKKRFAEWSIKRPAAIAAWETIQATNAYTRESYRAAGVRRIKWVNYEESCPYCRALDGKVVEIGQAFLTPDMVFQPEGADHALKLKYEIHHPPAHRGCTCMIIGEV